MNRGFQKQYNAALRNGSFLMWTQEKHVRLFFKSLLTIIETVLGNIKYLPKRNIDEADDDNEIEETLSGSSKKKRKLDISKSTLLPQNECLFCAKEYIYVKWRKELKLSKCHTVEAKTAIYEAAKKNKDTRILQIWEAYCRIAKEARYHATCRRDYIRKSTEKANVPNDD